MALFRDCDDSRPVLRGADWRNRRENRKFKAGVVVLRVFRTRNYGVFEVRRFLVMVPAAEHSSPLRVLRSIVMCATGFASADLGHVGMFPIISNSKSRPVDKHTATACDSTVLSIQEMTTQPTAKATNTLTPFRMPCTGIASGTHYNRPKHPKRGRMFRRLHHSLNPSLSENLVISRVKNTQHDNASLKNAVFSTILLIDTS